MSFEDRLANLAKLTDYNDRRNECYRIINDCIVVPMLPALIESKGHLCTSSFSTGPNNFHIYGLNIYMDKESKKGFWYNLGKFFEGSRKEISIHFNNQLWTCTYYRDSFFPVAEQIKEAYYAKLHEAFGYDMVVINGT